MYYALNVEKMLWATGGEEVSGLQKDAKGYEDAYDAAFAASVMGLKRKECTWGVFKFTDRYNRFGEWITVDEFCQNMEG